MISIEFGILTGMLLLLALVTYLWFTRDDPRRFEPGPGPAGEYPYPPLLSDFPEPVERRELYDWLNPGSRLATTAELRQLAFAGNMDVINSEVAAWKALMQLDEWSRK